MVVIPSQNHNMLWCRLAHENFSRDTKRTHSREADYLNRVGKPDPYNAKEFAAGERLVAGCRTASTVRRLFLKHNILAILATAADRLLPADLFTKWAPMIILTYA